MVGPNAYVRWGRTESFQRSPSLQSLLLFSFPHLTNKWLGGKSPWPEEENFRVQTTARPASSQDVRRARNVHLPLKRLSHAALCGEGLFLVTAVPKEYTTSRQVSPVIL